MGNSRETTTTTSNQTTRPEPTPEEREMNQIALARERELAPHITGAQRSGLDLVKQLLEGQENLPGFFEGLQKGIDPEVTKGIVDESLADLTPQFASSGLLDSGVRAAISGRVAGDIRRASEEFNIGNRLNLLNLALSGQAQVQTPVLGASASFGNRLAGLRTVNQTGSGSSTWTGPNTFWESFQKSAGTTIGNSPQWLMKK